MKITVQTVADSRLPIEQTLMIYAFRSLVASAPRLPDLFHQSRAHPAGEPWARCTDTARDDDTQRRPAAPIPENEKGSGTLFEFLTLYRWASQPTRL